MAFVHVFTPGEIIQRINSDNTVPQRPNCSKLVDLTAPLKGEAMKNLLVVCLILSLTTVSFAQTSQPEMFMTAERTGDPNPRYFFLWSTSAGKYIMLWNGMGEFTYPQGMRKPFRLMRGMKAKLERVCYLEHDRDLFLLYEVRDEGFYLARMEQTKRKIKWSTPLGNLSGEDPSMDGDVVRVGKSIEINKADGRVLRRD
jgi:hypothetical protein